LKNTMPRPEFEDHEIWEKLYATDENQLATGLVEHSLTEGEDGEREFDRRVLSAAKGLDVIDIGCGSGEFTLQVAVSAKTVAGIDFSERALGKALENLLSKEVSNVEFRLARAEKLPYPSRKFDLAMSRRGPIADTGESLTEAYRVLRNNGQIMFQDIGERDKQNWARVFGRGQMYPGTKKVSLELKRKLAQEGFKNIKIDEFEATEYFLTIQDVLMRLENSPIIPDFDRNLDKKHVEEIERRFMTQKGIRTNTHRVLVAANK
jgi:ubiquinone/menaquinone biosynthesis C-methylase UbiE